MSDACVRVGGAFVAVARPASLPPPFRAQRAAENAAVRAYASVPIVRAPVGPTSSVRGPSGQAARSSRAAPVAFSCSPLRDFAAVGFWRHRALGWRPAFWRAPQLRPYAWDRHRLAAAGPAAELSGPVASEPEEAREELEEPAGELQPAVDVPKWPPKPKPGRSLAEVAPDVARELDVQANGGLRAEDVPAGSNCKLWWRCPSCGHRYLASPNLRTRKKAATGCPECARNKINTTLPGRPSRKALSSQRLLSVVRPDLAKQWCKERNPKRPDEVTYGSGERVWWKCKEGHEWPASIKDRTGKNDAGCPYCSPTGWGATEENCLATVNPLAAAEWHPTRNAPLTPRDVRANAGTKFWFQCRKCGHEWRASPNSRTTGETGCPACAGQVATANNNLALHFPTLAEEWDKELNGDLAATDVTPGSGKRVGWRCPECGHRWEARLANRTKAEKPTGCPECNRPGRKHAQGINP